jgi:hypothetical protein
MLSLGAVMALAPPASAVASSRVGSSQGRTTKPAPKRRRCVTPKSKRKAHATAEHKLKRCRTVRRSLKKAPATPQRPSIPSVPPPPSSPSLALTLSATPPPAESLLPMIPAAPVNTVLPTIVGSTVERQVLEARVGSWAESPTSYAYQWQDCNASGEGCSNVSGAASASKLLGAGDVGHTLRVVVTATNAGGSATASSAATALVRQAESSTPLIGSATVQPSGDTDSAGLAEAFEYTAPASGVVRSLALYVNSGNNAPEIAVGLYSNLAGHPGQLLTGATIDSPKASAWNVVGVAPLAVEAGSAYWLAALAPTGTLALRDVADGGGPTQNSGSASLSELPASWSSGASWANSPASFYASSEPAGSPPAAPTNTAPPAISGSALAGDTLSASVGTWTGSPTSYAYQWEDCDAAGGACSVVAGATSPSYTLLASDVGHTMRVVVTAANAGGSTPASSVATAEVTGSDVSCSVTVSPGVGVGVIASDVVSAADGATVCLAGGSYPAIHIEGAVHGSYVTVRPAPGATATVAGIEVADSSFLRFQGLRMTEGFNMRDGSASASHDYQFIENTFEEPHYGVVLYGGSAPIKKVLIEGNHFNHVVFTEKIGEGRIGECHAGYAEGAGVTLFYAEGVTIARNTFDEVDVHYIQGGSSGPEGAVVEHNLFEGYTHYECVHLNLWQIWTGGENDTFRDNIAIGKGTKAGVGPFKNGDEEAATDGVLFENGAGSAECGVTMKNSVIENNLFVDAGDSYELQVYTTDGATIRDNTVVGSAYGTALLTEACGAGSDYTMTHNIDVQNGSGSDFGFGSCSAECSFDYNVSQDTSANSNGATHYVTGWSPKWSTTTWNPASEPKAPAGFYIPTGLAIEAGYQGNAGP